MGTCQLMENTLTEKHQSSRIAWSRVDNPIQKIICREVRGKEGQCQQGAVEPMMVIMMMMMIIIIIIIIIITMMMMMMMMMIG
jgi:hypothetical protein